MNDRERARSAEPAWDEVRERRVLSRVIAARDAHRARSRTTQRVTVLAAAALVLIAVGALGRGWLAPEEHASVVASAPPPPSRLTLGDGSIVELGEGARVQVTRDEASEVRVAHESGEARYVVSHVPARTFTVACGTVEVIVRGTRFVVRRDGSLVTVDVEEGRVEVRRDGQSSMLVRGESLRVDGSAHVEVPTEPAIEAPAEPSAQIAPAARPRVDHARPSANVDALLAEADTARREHRPDDAARALRAAVDALGDDRRAATPLFVLARVERGRGHDAEAARAFADAYARDPDAALAEDALAESVVSYAAAGREADAHAGAERYAARYPAGRYAERVRAALAPH